MAEDIRQEMRELRLHLGLSQERFARLLGVSWVTVHRWEQGLSRPSPLAMARMEAEVARLKATAGLKEVKL